MINDAPGPLAFEAKIVPEAPVSSSKNRWRWTYSGLFSVSKQDQPTLLLFSNNGQLQNTDLDADLYQILPDALSR